MAAPTLLLHLPPPPLPSGFKASSFLPPSLPSFLENEVDDGMEEERRKRRIRSKRTEAEKEEEGLHGWLDGWLLSGGTNPQDVVPCRLNEYL